MFWWETIHATFITVGNISRELKSQNWRINTMHEDIQALKDKAAAIDAKGDAILALLADVKAKLAAIVDNATELAAAKAAIAEVTVVLDSQLQQFDAALVEEPPVDPV